MTTLRTLALALALALLAATVPAHAQAPARESGVMLPAAQLLAGEKLLGTSYRVRDQVPTDGYLAHFTIDSDYGTFTATGVPEARRRIAEVEAIRKLVETSRSDLFAEGLRRSVEQPVDAVKNIVRHPVDTVKQAPKTAGHFFHKVGSSIGRGVGKVADRVENAVQGGQTDAGEAAADIGNAAKSAAGFDKAKLDTARQLGVDPYSDNPRLQEEMDKVTWAFFAGGLPLRIGAAAASAGIAVTATQMAGLPEETYALTPAELAVRDQAALEGMGVTAQDISAFQIQRHLSPSLQHRIVNCLVALPRADGRGSVIRLAIASESPEQARFLAAALAILAERQQQGAADYRGLQVLGRLPGGTTASGALHVPAPVDHVTWTEEVASFATRDDLGTGEKVLVHTGSLSPAAASGISAAGWKAAAVRYPAR